MQLNRRQAIGVLGATLAKLGTAFGASAQVRAATSPLERYGAVIRLRDSWASGIALPGGLQTEERVRVLLIHHSDTSNTYQQSEVPKILRGIWAHHTGPAKRWPDVAYNFFVDRFGGIWEGRAGSVRSPVVGSATGGNQGSSQLICLLGSHGAARPTDASIESLCRLLAGMGARYGIPSQAESRTEFVSRGSNRWPAGSRITANAIDGHRAMSFTDCPGHALWDLLPQVRRRVQDLRADEIAKQQATR